MAPVQHFRSAFHGFNRKDVVQYIEYLNNQHKAQIEQLQNQVSELTQANKALAQSINADRHNELAGTLQHMLPDGEPEEAPSEIVPEDPKQRPWWKKIFG